MPGHVEPVIAAAAGLVARGHEVVFHTGSLFQAQVERTGARFVPLFSAIDIDYRDIDKQFPERARLPPGPAQMLWGVRHLFGDSIAAQHEGLLSILRGFAADAILADMMFLGTLPLLLGPRTQRPTIVHLGISCLALTAPEVAFFGSALPPARTEQQRARNEAVTHYMHGHVFAPIQSYIDEVLKKRGTGKLPCFVFDAVIRLPDTYLQIGVPELEYERANLPASIRFVGALPPSPSKFDPPVWWDDVRQARTSGRPVILLTQGTLANTDFSQLVIPAMQALADREVLVIVTTSVDSASVAAVAPDNARVVRFIPYWAVLQHVDLLITNGGYGSVLQALSFGIPMLIAGDSEEKPEIAARLAHAGVAIDLATGRPSVALLGAALDDILTNPVYRSQAEAVAVKLRAIDAIGAIEAALVGQPTRQAA
jgi:MGT family glycosyltransferase